MALVRSAFWLGVAFMAIGPQTDWGQSLRNAGQDALGVSTAIAQEHIAGISCTDFVCETQKSIATHTVAGLSADAADVLETPLQQPVTHLDGVPIPAPRLDRKN